MKLPLIAILVVSVVSVVLIAGVYELGILGINDASVAIIGVSPANHSAISGA